MYISIFFGYEQEFMALYCHFVGWLVRLATLCSSNSRKTLNIYGLSQPCLKSGKNISFQKPAREETIFWS
jgi:hypothetical protein